MLRNKPKAIPGPEEQLAERGSQLRRRGWTAADIGKELDVPYADARRLVRRSDAKYGRPDKTIRNARKTAQQATIREMRQNFTAFLRRVKAGETVEVLERGTPVALLVPKPKGKSALERLIASGQVQPAERSLKELGPPLKMRLPMSMSEALQDVRRDRF